MSYTTAFIMEAQRLGTLVPLGVPPVANADTELNGFLIPKGTMLLENIWLCHFDERYWEAPNEFRPERFLDENGNLRSNVPSFLPFGLGRRQCIGESLAKMESFLFVAIFMQKFSFCVPKGHPISSKEGDGSFIVNCPKPYKFILRGPWGVPILGYVPFLFGRNILEKFHRLKVKHGDLFHVNLAGKDVVVLNEWRLVREAFGRPQFSDRADLVFLRLFSGGNNGKQFEHGDPELQQFLDRLTVVKEDSFALGPLQVAPGLLYFWPSVNAAYRRCVRNVPKLLRIFSKEMEEHKKLDREDSPRDYIDAYLQKMKSVEERGGHSNFTGQQLCVNVSDLFFAGSETTTNTIRWCVLFLLRHPDVQRRIQFEVDEVVGRYRTPSLHDRHQLSQRICDDAIFRMPYTEAFIMEAQRLGTLVPLGVPHVANVDTELNSFLIPKGTMLLGNIWSCHFDERYWEAPNVFRPERFLDENGNLRSNVPSFLPFGLGRRQCIGESLAKMELFLFVAIFMQKFSFCVPKGHPIPSKEGDGSFIVNCPKPYKFILRNRSYPEDRVHA
ncbi:unnamed protein product [Darwinula stevensoni]|uniref:Cytochrome P450 n=1 Tax=Darwinula stevensoni TaxID=69355 RepID=A0A7R8XK66_9CRUS|nr:unnamed protein product [Darwinula stevensoni]CAG0896004.1 unnamed protein product [Darwinula stevensoni]